MHTEYKELDDAICAHLEREPWRHPIYVESLARVAARELGRGDLPHGDDKEWRLIDRRLQALRKAGRIRYVRETGLKPRWEVCDAQRSRQAAPVGEAVGCQLGRVVRHQCNLT